MNLLRLGALFCALSSAALRAQAPEVCAGDGCGAVRDQLAAAASRIDGDRNQFVSAVRKLIQTIPAADGIDASMVTASVDELGRALVRWDQSIRTYRTLVLEAAGQVPDGHIALTAVYVERGNGREALKEAQAAIALDPARPDAYILQALAYDLEKRPADAAQAFAKAAKLSEGNPAATYGLAQRLIVMGDEAGATAALHRFTAAQATDGVPSTEAARAPAAPFVRVGLLRQLAGIAPLFPPAAYVSGFARLADGAFEQAVAEFRNAVTRVPSSTRRLGEDQDIQLGAEALRRADLRSALGHLKAAVERWPDLPEPRRLLGAAYQADEQYDRSIEQLRAASKLSPIDDLARRALADVLVLAGRLEDAAGELRAALDAVPSPGGGLHYQLALVYQSLGQNGAAIRELEQAAVLPPVVGQNHLYDLLGVLYTSDADLDGALRSYRRRVLVNPNDSEAHRKLGQIYLEQGRHEEAAAEFAAALLLDPSNAEACAGRAQIYLRLGGYANAVAWASRALRINRTHTAAQYSLGSSLLRLGRSDEGNAALEEFRRLQAASQSATNRGWELKLTKQAAQAKIDQGDLDGAVLLLQQVVTGEPNIVANHVNLGLVLARAGRYADAIEAYRKALDLSADANVHGHLAAAYAALGRAQESQTEEAQYERAKERRIRGGGAGR